MGSADYTESAKRRTRISGEGETMKTVEAAFAGFGRGEATMPPKVYLPIEDHDGDFRAMPARLGDSAGIKWVNVHAQNRKRYGLPTVMAVYVLNDPANAFPLAVMDGTLLTALRTGAAGAVATTAQRFADRVGARVASLEEAAGADIVCTATPSRTPLVQARWIRPGAHINAMGADAPGKRELTTETLKNAAVYIDDIHQAAGSGEINVPLAAGDFSLDLG
jgi:ornithine cyclodeaminase/alanine dehydrogenase